MTKMLRYRFSASLLTLICLGWMACENNEAEVRSLTQKTIAVEEGTQIETFYSQGGILKARLTAPVMRRFQTDSPYIEFPKSLHVDFYNTKTRQLESQLNARYGKYRETENKVLLRDSVEVFNVKGDTLRCPELWWEQSKQQFYTTKPVRIHTRDKVIYGNKGMVAGQDFTWWEIFSSSGSILVPSDSLP